jgi:hypothetical protein
LRKGADNYSINNAGVTMKSNDVPVTDKELEAHYGTAPSETERQLAIGVATANFDAGELSDTVYYLWEKIEECALHNDVFTIGKLVLEARRQRIADRASMKLFRKVGSIKSSEVL